MSINFKQYGKSINVNHLFRLIIFFVVAYLLYFLVIKPEESVIVNEFFSKIPEGDWSNVLLTILMIYCLIKLSRIIKYKLLPTPSSIFFLILTIVFYECIVKSDGQYNLFSFEDWGMPMLKYSDLALYAVCFLNLNYRTYNKGLVKHSFISLIGDEADVDSPDLLNREGQISKLVESILATSTKSSYSIGIFATWGSGKTTFLKRIERALKEYKENVVFEFNPWKAATKEGMLQDFFSTLSNELKPYNKSAVALIRDYSKRILSDSKNVEYKIIDNAIDFMLKESSIQKTYDELNSIIKSTGKRFIIIIDDLDRMNGIEIMQVLRLIRNSANFENTFFIVALDHEYVIDVLKETHSFSREEEYLKKIFQLIITLPPIVKYSFANEITKQLIHEEMSLVDREKIEKVLALLTYDGATDLISHPKSAKQEGLLEKMLDNYRDVKRFCNSFKLSFSVLKDDVETLDLFLLELIKHKSFPIYESISTKTILGFSEQSPYSYVLHEERWTKLSNELKLNDYKQDSFREALTRLIEESEHKGLRQFSYPHNFYLFFNYQLFDLIPLAEFKDVLESDWKAMASAFSKWITEGKERDLDRIIESIDDFKDKEQLINFIQALLVNEGLTTAAIKIVTLIERNTSLYYNNDREAYKLDIRKILLNAGIPNISRAKLANELIKNSVYGKEDLLLPKTDLQDIIYDLFDEFLRDKVGFDSIVDEFYFLNDDWRDNDNYIRLNERAHKKLLEFLLERKENLEGFLKLIIRSLSIPNNERFVFAPFAKEIFNNDWNEFRKVLVNFEESNKGNIDVDVKNILRYIYMGVDQYIAGSKEFILTGENKDNVINHLRRTGQYTFPR